MTLKPGAHIHLMGICGTAMASLAGLLKTLGYKITGSDQNVYPPMSTQLRDLGITIQEGYKKENLTPRPDFVVVGNVISKANEEAQALLATDIPYTSLPKAMGEFAIASRHSIVIAGTHGKTTTTSMMIKVADQCGVKPGYMVGGIPVDFGLSFRVAEGDYFIIEGDEYDTAFFDKVPKFIHYKPRTAILTSVEFDHADIYRDLDHVMSAFRLLIERLPADGCLVACADDENVMKLAGEAKCRVVTYGAGESALKRSQAARSTAGRPLVSRHYQVVEREMLEGRNQFAAAVTDLSVSGGAGSSPATRKLADIAVRLPGEHNALNAIAVFAVAQELGFKLSSTLQGLATFQGVKRRQEVIGTPKGVTLIEDFAHHPTAVKVTTEAIREKYLGEKTRSNSVAKSAAGAPAGKRLICLFEPRSATSRRKVFQKDYVRAFNAGDKIYIAKAFDQSKIAEADRFSTQELVDDMKAAGQDAYEMNSSDDIVESLKREARQGDVILIMSNGGFDGIYQKLLKALV